MVSQLRVHVHGSDLLVARLRLAAALRTVHLNPVRLAPPAILCIKKFRDPLPGTLGLQSMGALLPRAWEQAVLASLERVAKHAVHPAHSPVPPGADAVFFADEGEMLACLALDMSRGQATDLWWWRGLLRSLPSCSAAGLQALLCTHARTVPAALHHLAARERAATVMEALSLEEARTTLGAICRAYGLPDLHLEPLNSVGTEDARIQTDSGSEMRVSQSEERRRKVEAEVSWRAATTRADRSRASPGPTRSESDYSSPARLWGSTDRPPWEKWLEAGVIPFDLAKERACLLGLGLTLYRAPAAARSDAFLRGLRNWWAAPCPPSALERTSTSATAAPVKSLRTMQSQADRSTAERPGAAMEGEKAPYRRPQDTRSPLPILLQRQKRCDESFDLRLLPDRGQRGTADAPGIASHGVSRGSVARQTLGPEPGSRPGAWSEDLPTGRGPRIPQAPEKIDGEAGPDYRAGIPSVLAETSLSMEGGIDTQQGGILYLINLMAHLDLPACFENDWGLASRVGAWGVLETLARGLLDEDGRDLSRDPIWTVLAQLDGREPGTLPGAGFRGGECFCLPAPWLTHLEEPERELFGRTALADLRGSLAEVLNPGLSGWLSFVLPYIRVRLRRALDPDGTETFDLQDAMLLRQGRLYVTSTHVDLVMSLGDVSVPIRMAGLDCNPGWMPEFGRVILFHFE